MEQLQYQLKSIRLSGMAQTLPMRLQEARANELPHLDFLSALVTDELEKRKERLLARRLKAARFPILKTLDEFDFTFNPTINKRQIRELATCRFVHGAENVLLLAPPGVGKTHLAIAFGIAAEDLLEIFHRRYQLGANMIATNRPIEDWGKILGDNATTSAILDRFMDNIHLIKITGRSYRVKSLHKKLDKTKAND